MTVLSENIYPGGGIVGTRDSQTTLQLEENQSFRKVKNYWNRRTYLEKCFLILFLIFLFLIGGLILGLIIQNMKKFSTAEESLIDQQELCQTTECLETLAHILPKIDLKANPCSDFYNFACGGWNKANPISDDIAHSTVNKVMYTNQMISLKAILFDQFSQINPSPGILKTKNFYESCMDTYLIKKRGQNPAVALLKKLGGFQLNDIWNGTKFDLTDLLTKLMEYNFAPLFDISFIINVTDSSKYVLMIDGPSSHKSIGSENDFLDGIIRRPKRMKTFDKYNMTVNWNEINRDKSLDSLITDENLNVIVWFQLMSDNGKIQAEYLNETLEFINDLNEILHDTAEYPISKPTMTVAELNDLIPVVSWERILQSLLKQPISLKEIVYVPYAGFLRSISNLIKSKNERTLQNSLLILFAKDSLWELGLTQIYVDVPRWEYCLRATRNVFGELVSAAYLRTHSEIEVSKYIDQISDMFTYIKEALIKNLKSLNWMDSATLTHALEKINFMDTKFVTSSIFSNTSFIESTAENISIDGNFFENVLNYYMYRRRFNFQRYEKTVDKNLDIWTKLSLPIIYNAFNIQYLNAIVIPLAYLIQPNFYFHGPHYINFGAMGCTIGHEIIHGFDSNGISYDKFGHEKSTWSNKTKDIFNSKANCFIKQYGSINYTIPSETNITSIFIDGGLTLNENIADNGGLRIAFEAYQKWISKHGHEKQLPVLQLNPEQLFFIATAQRFCGRYHSTVYKKVLEDSHSPIPARLNVMLQNSLHFSKAFKCPAGSPMNPSEKCVLW